MPKNKKTNTPVTFTRDTRRSRISWTEGEDVIRFFSKTLGKERHTTPINSRRGRYVLGLLLRRGSTEADVGYTYKTRKNSYLFIPQERLLRRHDLTTGHRSATDITASKWAESIARRIVTTAVAA